MAKRTIELENRFTVERAGTSVDVDVSKLPDGIVAQLVLHGLTQKIGDAAAGAVATTFEAQNSDASWSDQNGEVKAKFKATEAEAIQATAKADMEAVAKQLASGEWGVVRSGSGLSPLDREMVSIVRKSVSGLESARYKDAKEAERVEMCREYIGKLKPKQREDLERMAQTRIDARLAEKAALAEIGISL